jgi:hypothetical protein
LVCLAVVAVSRSQSVAAEPEPEPEGQQLGVAEHHHHHTVLYFQGLALHYYCIVTVQIITWRSPFLLELTLTFYLYCMCKYYLVSLKLFEATYSANSFLPPSIRVNSLPLMPDTIQRPGSLSIRSKPIQPTPPSLRYSHSYLTLPCLGIIVSTAYQHRHCNFNLPSNFNTASNSHSLPSYPVSVYKIHSILQNLLSFITQPCNDPRGGDVTAQRDMAFATKRLGKELSKVYLHPSWNGSLFSDVRV